MDNCVQAISSVLKQLKVRYTTKYVEDTVLSHPEHPSLFSISDTLDKFNIETLAVKIEEDKYSCLPFPFFVQVKKQRQSLFYVIDYFDEKVVKYYDEMNRKLTKAKDDFLKLWTGVCLLVEASNKSKEEGIEQKIAKKRIHNFLIGSVVSLFLVWTILNLINSEITISAASSIFFLGYFLLKLIGLGIGTMLLWFEVDQYNPMLQKICTGANKKLNCNAVLNSRHASFLNGSISLSLLSFSYFFGGVLFLIIQGFSVSVFTLLGWLSFFATPFLILSLFSQAIVIKQWCKLCIAVQTVLFLEILLVYWSGFYTLPVAFEFLPLLFLVLMLPLTLWNPIKSLLKNKKEIHVVKRGLSKIKNNSEVFKSLLHRSKKIKNNAKGLGIRFKNQEAKYHILKICNPYCGPCAEAQPVLEGLLKSGKISLQILFTAKDSEENIGKPVAHFLAIADEGNQEKTQKALDDWYSSKHKDYQQFAKKYTINKKLETQDQKIKAMSDWCG